MSKTMTAVPKAQTVNAPKASIQAGGGSAVPDSNTLLAYKLLQESWKGAQVFEDLLHNEMKYLVAGISLLNNDPYLAMKMGGVTLNNAGQLANVLKNKVQEIDINKRIEPVASSILLHEFSKPNMQEMLPNRRPATTLFRNKTDGRVQLNFHAGAFKNTGLDLQHSNAARNLNQIIGMQENAAYGSGDHYTGVSYQTTGSRSSYTQPNP